MRHTRARALSTTILGFAFVFILNARAYAASCGDLNGNGRVNIADVVLLFRVVLENPDPTPLCGGAGAADCGDISRDGAIDVKDVVMLLAHSLNNDTTLCALDPIAGRLAYLDPSIVRLPLGLEVTAVGGNLIIPRTDLSLDTYLGTWSATAYFNSALRSWRFNFETRYDGSVFVDPTSARHSVSGLANGSQIPGTHWVKLDNRRVRTLGGLVYEYRSSGVLWRIYWQGDPGTPRLETSSTTIGGTEVVSGIQQCLTTGCSTLATIVYTNGRISAIIDLAGRQATYTYDNDRLASARDPLDNALGRTGYLYTYNAAFDHVTVQTPDGETFTLVIMTRGQLRRVEYGEGNAWDFGHIQLPDGTYRTRVRSPDGSTKAYFYDSASRLMRLEHDAGLTEYFTWDSGPFDREIKRHTDIAGLVTQFTRSANSLTIASPQHTVTLALEPITSNSTNAQDQHQRAVREVTDGGTLLMRRDFDAAGRVAWEENGQGDRVSFAYGANRALITKTNPNGVSELFTNYGNHGHAGQITVAGRTAVFEYDLVGNLTSSQLPSADAGGVTRWEYDANRNRSRIHVWGFDTYGAPATDDVIEIDYRSDGQPLAIRRPHGGDTLFGYQLGELTTRSELVSAGTTAAPVARTTTFTRDDVGRILSVDHPNGMREEMGYDKLGRTTSARYLDNGALARSVTFTYDGGRLKEIAGTNGFLERYGYDTAGRVAAITYTHGEYLLLTYDARSRLATREYRQGTQTIAALQLGYDDANRPNSLSLDGTSLLTNDYAQGRMTAQHFGNGLERTYSYTTDSGVFDGATTLRGTETIETTDALEFNNFWLQANSWSTETNTTGVGPVETIEYYNLEQLNRVGLYQVNDSGTPGFAYDYHVWDHLSNLLFVGNEAYRPRYFHYNAERNRLLKARSFAIPIPPEIYYSYDAAGFTTARGDTAISWTSPGLPTSVGARQFFYDAAGRLEEETLPNHPTRTWRWGGQIEMLANTPGWMDVGPIRIDLEAGNHLYRHLDYRGNVKFVSDGSGDIVTHYRNTGLGVSSVVGFDGDDVRFAQGRDLGDVYLLGGRLYDPLCGRFLSPDPVYNDINGYTYSLGNPVQFWDPDGRRPEDVGAFSVAGIVLTSAAVFVPPTAPYATAFAVARLAFAYGSFIYIFTKDTYPKNPSEWGVTSSSPVLLDGGWRDTSGAMFRGGHSWGHTHVLLVPRVLRDGVAITEPITVVGTLPDVGGSDEVRGFSDSTCFDSNCRR